MNAGIPAARSPSAARCAVGTAGSVCGVLDIAYVFVVFGWRDGRAARILQGITVSVLGPAASSAAEVTPPGRAVPPARLDVGAGRAGAVRGVADCVDRVADREDDGPAHRDAQA